MNNTLRYFWPAALWAIFIFVICNISLGKVGGSPLFFEGFDKFTHCGLFFVMTVLYCSGYLRKYNLTYLSAVKAIIITGAIILYGGVIEILQEYIFTWRSGDWTDLFADTVGTCMGIFSVIIITASVKK